MSGENQIGEVEPKKEKKDGGAWSQILRERRISRRLREMGSAGEISSEKCHIGQGVLQVWRKQVYLAGRMKLKLFQHPR